MLQLTYISTAARDIPAGAVGEILSASRRNNAASGVTGLLLYDGRRFLQALEGEMAMVHATFERIKADPRHRAIVLLSSAEVGARAFGDWAMAAHQASPVSAGPIVQTVDALTAAVADASMRELFRGFARVRGAA